jgi:hypothetical protein
MFGRLVRPLALSVAVLALVATAVTSATALGGVPTSQTFQPAGLGVAFELPANWGKDLPPDGGWQWQAIAPGFVAHLYLGAGRVKVSSATFGAGLTSALRERVTKADPRASFTSSPARIGSVSAVKIVARYRVGGPGKLVVYIYGFVHSGMAYVFEYTTTSNWIDREKPAFDFSAKSIRFPNVV